MSTDLEFQLQRAWNPDVKPLITEAWRCYSTGAIRASIAMTWVAVCADLTAKIRRLAEDGEAEAKAMATKIERAEQAGLTAAGVATMQDVERTLVDAAEKLELVDFNHRW